ncbi:MAG: helix-turn-helix domain-containing protein, partial [Phyllobacteriaceae bacterium]|nr:helix-turn-helix domain-containing protein [Phyllobacteriaceae bacterium]
LQGGGGRFDDLHAWIVAHLDRPLGLADLAERAAMSLRSFSRHYRAATGRTPARAVEELRLESARRLLEQGQPIGRVVRQCGFGSEETLRRIFHRHFGIGPQAYRERFSG